MLTVQHGHNGCVGGGVPGDGQGPGEHDPLAHIGLLLSGHRVEDVAQLLQKHRREVVVTEVHAYIHTYIHRSIHTYIHVHIQKNKLVSLTYIHSFIHVLLHTYSTPVRISR